jgi:hypothetical protein
VVAAQNLKKFSSKKRKLKKPKVKSLGANLILFVEPISKNFDLYVPAYPLPLMELASFCKSTLPQTEIEVVSMSVDYGLPLSKAGRAQIYKEFMRDLAEMKPKGVGISCTAIAQADEAIQLCELIKSHDPEILVFLGGYFPTIYYEEIFSRTRAVDIIVRGEGEAPALRIVDQIEKGRNPFDEAIPNLVWGKNGDLCLTKKDKPFDLNKKATLDLGLLRLPRKYDVLPYAFSRGCPYRCDFCMEGLIRPLRREVPAEIVRRDLDNLSRQSNAQTLLVSDALFTSFDKFSMLKSLGMEINFETRCDVADPSAISKIAEVCGIIAIGLESASYKSLRRMNKIKDKAHFEKYISNTLAVFREASKYEIPLMVFMIAGYPGDTEEDLQQSLAFAAKLSGMAGPGGHVFKIGECRVYPKTKLHRVASSMEGVVFDDRGVFGDNIVRQPSKSLDFEKVLSYMKQVFNLSNSTIKLEKALSKVMPLFRVPALSLNDPLIPDRCYRGEGREILNVQGDSLSVLRSLVPRLKGKYKDLLSEVRQTRELRA